MMNHPGMTLTPMGLNALGNGIKRRVKEGAEELIRFTNSEIEKRIFHI